MPLIANTPQRQGCIDTSEDHFVMARISNAERDDEQAFGAQA
jgi:hypothetical protein